MNWLFKQQWFLNLRAKYWALRLYTWTIDHPHDTDSKFKNQREEIYREARFYILRSRQNPKEYSPRFECMNAIIEMEDVEYRWIMACRGIHNTTSLFTFDLRKK